MAMKYLELRNALGLSQAEMAKALGVSLRTYSRYEKGDEEVKEVQRKSLLSSTRSVATSVDDFAKIIKGHHFYVDKTKMIEDLLSFNPEGVTLFTRPRRFGKSLNLSMLYHFFSNTSDSSLFDGLYISSNEALCKKHQNHYPAILLSLKDVHGLDYESFISLYGLSFSLLASKYAYLLDSPSLGDNQKLFIKKAIDHELNDVELSFSLRNLSRCLHLHHGVPVAMFIDEYDVPLEKASKLDCYPKVLSFMQVLFSSAFKSNEDVAFAVLTGCLRENKENLFTGFNNASVYGLLDEAFAPHFGFTEEEVGKALNQFGLMSRQEEIKRWYDGYRIGGYDIYCPYDICCLLQHSLSDSELVVESYWKNSSANEVIYDLLVHGDKIVQGDIETLMEGKSVYKDVDLALSYRDLSYQDESIWGLLLSTGYLTVKSKQGRRLELTIPNQEILDLFQSTLYQWVKKDLIGKFASHSKLLPSLLEGDEKGIETSLNAFLMESLGVHDYARNEKEKEAFYHALLLGLVSASSSRDISIKSNIEVGEGYPDLCLFDINNDRASIIETKYAYEGNFDGAIKEGESQFERCHYEDGVGDSKQTHKIVIAFYKKRCKVKVI